ILQKTLAPTLKAIDSNIYSKVCQFQKNAEAIDQGTGSQLATQFSLSINQVAPQFQFNTTGNSDQWETVWDVGIGGISGLGGGGLLAGGLAFAVSSIAFFPVVLTGGAIVGIAAAGAALGTAIGGAIGFFSTPDQEGIKQEVITEGFKQFYAQDGANQLIRAIDTLVRSLFDQRLTTIQTITRQYLELLNSLLSDSEAAHARTVSEVAEEHQWYQNQLSKLVSLQAQLDGSLDR
ncbi:MAG: hypothetical protein SFW36_15500, partial [Leptolyngbyaceae cyanobacterium bins.59]|nr:hypothetical protein [Leptolyngbyaceae cyanobacterium bins.59]